MASLIVIFVVTSFQVECYLRQKQRGSASCLRCSCLHASLFKLYSLERGLYQAVNSKGLPLRKGFCFQQAADVLRPLFDTLVQEDASSRMVGLVGEG